MRIEALDIKALLRVPFVAKGRGTDGWDCVGCALFVTRTAFGVRLPDWLDGYDGTDRAAAGEMAAAIGRGMERFVPCAPRAGAWLLFQRFGVPVHIGVALDRVTMIHADDAGAAIGRARVVSGGGTYTARFDADPWARRLVGAWMPKEMAVLPDGRGARPPQDEEGWGVSFETAASRPPQDEEGWRMS